MTKTQLWHRCKANRWPLGVVLLINALLWSWLWVVHVGRLADQTLVAYIIITFAYTVIVGISVFVYTFAIKYLTKSYKNKPDWKWILKAIAIWALAEALTAWLVAFVWMGRNGSVDNVLPFGSLTPLLMYTPLRFLSRFVGFYGLSAITVVGIAIIYLKKVRKYAISYWVVVIILTTLAWGLYKTPNGQTIKATVVAETLDHKLPVQVNGSKLVILPEYGLDDPLPSEQFKRFLPSRDAYYYVGSKQSPVPSGHTNVLIFGNSRQGNVVLQAKNRLIPGGEHLAYGVELALRIFSPTTLSDFQVRREVVRGTAPIQPYTINKNVVVGAEVCSSIMSTRDYRQLTKKGSTVLTNSASLDIFEGSRLFRWQQKGLATIMATANARPFLQSTNNWPAFILDQNGNLVAQTLPTSQVQAAIITNTKKTPYTYLGEWVAILGAVLIVFDFLKYKRKASH